MKNIKKIPEVAISVIAITLVCIFFSSPVRAQQEQTWVKASNWWLIQHNEIEKVINLMYYSWVDGDGDTFLSSFTPDVIWYDAYESDPELYSVWIPNKNMLKTAVADKAKEVKENFNIRILVVRHINMYPENQEKWVASGEVGNALGIAVAWVWETTIDKKTGEKKDYRYMDTYMMKRINGKWMISGGIRKVVEPSFEALFFGYKAE